MESLQAIVKSDEFLPFLLCVSEIVFCISHLFVHLGIKNPRLTYLTHQSMYFSMDGFLTTLNLIYFWERYFIIRFFLFYAILGHLYYVADLVMQNGISRIFYWSSVECKDNRFDLKYLKENLETLLDVFCHFYGAYNFFSLLCSNMTYACLISSMGMIYVGMVLNRDFLTMDYMMPKWLGYYMKKEPKKIENKIVN